MQNNPLETIQSYSSEFTKTDAEIAAYILENPSDVISGTLTMLAGAINVSEAAMIRFAHRVGYTGFSALKHDISRYIFSRNGRSEEDHEEVVTSSPLIAITDLYSRYIKAIADNTDMDTINRAADLFLRSEKVKIIGMNRTFNSAKQMRQRLVKLGFDAEAIDDRIILSDVVHYMTDKDLCIFFTTKNNLHFDEHINTLHERGCPFIVITMSHNLPYRKLASELITLPRISRDSRYSFLDDQAIFFVLIEVLLDAIATRSRQD